MLRLFVVFSLLMLPLSFSTTTAQSVSGDSPRERILFDDNWRFQKDDPAGAVGKLPYSVTKAWMLPTGNSFVSDPAARASRPDGNPAGGVSYAQPDFDDSGWRRIDLPHDWGIEGPFLPKAGNETGDRHYWGVGWYRKHFNISSADVGKQFFLDVDGAMSYATVWVNGQCAGGWPYGYASFQVDLTPYVKVGKENVLAIRLDNPSDSSRWYPGAGIYRHVRLVKTAPVHGSHWGVFVTTPEVSPNEATVDIKASVDNALDSPAQAQVQTAIYALDANGVKETPAVGYLNWKPSTVPAGGNASTDGQLRLVNPRLWNLDHPNLYAAVTSVRVGDVIVDRQETIFGIRTIKFDANNGFFLNGEHVPIHGVCMHSDLGALGTALNARALQRQVEILKEMGCNAIRTSHNPPSPELIDLCNRMGVLVMAESFDCWEIGKKSHDYHLLFDDWSEKDLRALVRHYRNDPCVILWSIGNEIVEQGYPQGPKLAKRLTAIVHEEDPTRFTAIACSNYAGGFNGFQHGVDVFAYNYKPWGYAKWHTTPDNENIPFVGTETSSTVSSRGEYFFPIEKSTQDFQVTSYDNWRPGWATLPDEEFKNQEQNPFVAGEFVWTGFDYLGEPTPFNSDESILLNTTNPEEKAKLQEQIQQLGKFTIPSRSSYFGIMDLAGFKKDRFYLYQAHWRPDFPMAHLLPHWNWPDRVGQVTPVYLYTSGDEAELFLNGQSLGRKVEGPVEYRLHWDVPYQPGSLEAVAYKNGKEWARDKVKTTGPVAQILLQPDRQTLKADGQDLSYVTVRVSDNDGLIVPRADNLVHFSITGPADIIAVDNGDPTDLASFQDLERKAFNGLLMVVIRTHKNSPGAITLQAESDALSPGQVSLSSK